MLKCKDFARSDTATQLHSVISKMQWWAKSPIIIIYYILYYNIIYNINITPPPYPHISKYLMTLCSCVTA